MSHHAACRSSHVGRRADSVYGSRTGSWGRAHSCPIPGLDFVTPETVLLSFSLPDHSPCSLCKTYVQPGGKPCITHSPALLCRWPWAAVSPQALVTPGVGEAVRAWEPGARPHALAQRCLCTEHLGPFVSLQECQPGGLQTGGGGDRLVVSPIV